MTWFTTWWAGLTLLQQSFAAVAIPATVLLLLQTVLLLFGLGGHDADHGECDHDFDHDLDHDLDHDFDHDFDHDPDLDHDADGAVCTADHDFADDGAPLHDGAHHIGGLRLFTLRGFIAMFAVGGWLGVALPDLGAGAVVTAIVALTGGLAALVLTALMIWWSLRMQSSGNLNAKNAIAHTATVYIPIPPARSDTGKVTMTLQERFVELDALTDSPSAIPTGTLVQVVRVTDQGVLVVRPMG